MSSLYPTLSCHVNTVNQGPGQLGVTGQEIDSGDSWLRLWLLRDSEYSGVSCAQPGVSPACKAEKAHSGPQPHNLTSHNTTLITLPLSLMQGQHQTGSESGSFSLPHLPVCQKSFPSANLTRTKVVAGGGGGGEVLTAGTEDHTAVSWPKLSSQLQSTIT